MLKKICKILQLFVVFALTQNLLVSKLCPRFVHMGFALIRRGENGWEK